MKEYKQGTKFTVCTHDELLNMGWTAHSDYYEHVNFPGDTITYGMIDEYQGQTLTVKNLSQWDDSWYHIEEDYGFTWPVATFLAQVSGHTCEEGMTPIDGWFICKNCGDNLREIK